MTVQDIKKALEICSEEDGCRECPYYDYRYCEKVLLKDALALINEQQYCGGKLPKTPVMQYGDEVVDYALRQEQVKQAKLEVLNELKDMLNDKPNGFAYIIYIDDMIKELQNDT